jgi:hypothetical protein
MLKGGEVICLCFFFDLEAGWYGMSGPLYHREKSRYYFIGGRMGPMAGLDGFGNYRPHRDMTFRPY